MTRPPTRTASDEMPTILRDQNRGHRAQHGKGHCSNANDHWFHCAEARHARELLWVDVRHYIETTSKMLSRRRALFRPCGCVRPRLPAVIRCSNITRPPTRAASLRRDPASRCPARFRATTCLPLEGWRGVVDRRPQRPSVRTVRPCADSKRRRTCHEAMPSRLKKLFKIDQCRQRWGHLVELAAQIGKDEFIAH